MRQKLIKSADNELFAGGQMKKVLFAICVLALVSSCFVGKSKKIKRVNRAQPKAIPSTAALTEVWDGLGRCDSRSYHRILKGRRKQQVVKDVRYGNEGSFLSAKGCRQCVQSCLHTCLGTKTGAVPGSHKVCNWVCKEEHKSCDAAWQANFGQV